LVGGADGQDSDVNLTDTNGKYDNMAPSRSPNAEWIVFTSNRDGNWELYLAPTDGNISQTRRLTFNETAIDTDPVWGPNNFVVFETNRNGNWDLHLLDMTTGKFYQLTSNTGNDVNPSWSNDGSKLVFQSDRSGKWQVYEMDMTTFQIRLLSDGKGNDMDPVYSEDNSRIAFRSDRDGAASQLYIMSANGANPTAISDKGGYATNQSWSPDSNLIAYQSDLDGDLDVYVYDVGTGETRQLTNNSIPDYAPTWRCATNQVIFTSDIGGAPDIFEAKPLPISDPGIAVNKDADQLTQYPADNIYPEGSPVEENASREGRLPDLSGILSGETSFLKPDVSIIPPDLSHDTGIAWEDIGDTCAPSGTRDDLKQG
jgi:TolB protein